MACLNPFSVRFDQHTSARLDLRGTAYLPMVVPSWPETSLKQLMVNDGFGLHPGGTALRTEGATFSILVATET
eukprot:4896055-Pleurochrysis_carterae.AAC.1